eukprot:CAMPEP_0118681332 /NCGR_PEP_ID=MMETSP0800-20121206/4876_1 /TAXON_ID=210618 ORGANISM="Striatella unipunctata, Strain CCMP2910" /NCGR_SAMPLE_ID=MMETSP0800 /ASSEMBLY_ACC=CAM_ASM_000638 /LENGTH=264 /DNA_ID=CAMNT_0006577609 /DNA_START=503 /DNA_END=1294 /DNA_ORIENTATION=+
MAVFLLLGLLSNHLIHMEDERDAMYRASLINLFVMVVGLTLMLVFSNDATTSPSTTAFLFAAVTNTIVLTTSWMLLRPKIGRIQSGETVVVSRLLDEPLPPRNELDASGASRASSIPDRGILRACSGVCLTAEENLTAQDFTSTTEKEESSKTSFESDDESRKNNSTSSDVISNRRRSFSVFELASQTSPRRTQLSSFRPVVMKQNEPPPRRFEKQLFTVNQAISHIATRSLAEGRPMEQEDWETLTSQVSLLNEMIERIEYKW